MLRFTLPGLALLLAVCAVQAVAASRSPADAACQDYRELRRQLAERYLEHPVSTALAADGTLVQVFASKERLTWTMLGVSPRGPGCLLATGRAWQRAEPPMPAIAS